MIFKAGLITLCISIAFATSIRGKTHALNLPSRSNGDSVVRFWKNTARQNSGPDPACICTALYDPVCCRFVKGEAVVSSNACTCKCSGGAASDLESCPPKSGASRFIKKTKIWFPCNAGPRRARFSRSWFSRCYEVIRFAGTKELCDFRIFLLSLLSSPYSCWNILHAQNKLPLCSVVPFHCSTLHLRATQICAFSITTNCDLFRGLSFVNWWKLILNVKFVKRLSNGLSL